jgi:hypothetical protein
MPSRGDELTGPLRFADDDDDAEIGGFTRGKRSYDEDEDEDGGWAINEDHSDRLWDSAEDVDDEDADEEGVPKIAEDDTEDEEEADLFGASPVRGRRGRPKGSGKKVEQPPSIFAGSENVFDDAADLEIVERPAPSAGRAPTSSSAHSSAKTAAKTAGKPATKAAAKKPAAKKAAAPKASSRKGGSSKGKPAGSAKKGGAKKPVKKAAAKKPAKSGGKKKAPAKKAPKKGSKRR